MKVAVIKKEKISKMAKERKILKTGSNLTF